MELDDLFKEEGLDAAGVEDALAWARRRAAELVRDVDGDPELGPLLDGIELDGIELGRIAVVGASEGPRPRATESTPVPSPAGLEEKRPLFTDLRGLQAAFLAENEDEDADLPEVGAVLRAFKKGKGRAGSGPVRSATATAAKPRLSLDGEAGPDTMLSLADLRAEARAEVELETAAPEAAPQSMAAAAVSDAATDDAQPDDAAAATDEGAPTLDRAEERDDRAEESDDRPEESDDRPEESDDRAEAASDDQDDAELDADATLPTVATGDATETTDDASTEATVAADASEPPTGDTIEVESEHGLPAPPEADLDPLAGIDFDDLPGVDEDDEEDDHTHVDLPAPGRVVEMDDGEGRTTMIPTDRADMTLPSMQAPLAELGRPRVDGSVPAGELTERTRNPLLLAEPMGDVTVTAMAPNPMRGASPETSVTDIADVTAPAEVEAAPADEADEEPAEDIELLDDEDLLLMEEEPEEEPEWKQALKSVEGKDGEDDDS
jgi:hypothetical protein